MVQVIKQSSSLSESSNSTCTGGSQHQQVAPTAKLFRAGQSLITLFALGGLYAMAIYTVPLDSIMPSVWPSSIGLMHFLSAPSTIFTGLLLESSPNKSKTARGLGILASICYIGFAIAAFALYLNSSLLLRFAVCMQSLPLGINYLLHCEILVAWFPQNPGAIVGCGLLFYNAGTIILSWVFSELISSFEVLRALLATSLILTIPSLIPALFLSFPSRALHPESQPLQEQVLRQTEQEPRRRKHVTKSLNFWLYFGAILSTGAPYALLPFFFRIGSTAPYSLGSSALLSAFQYTGAIGTLVALFSGVLCDSITSFFNCSGAKWVLFYALLLQIILFSCLSFFNNVFWFYIGVCLLVILTNCHYGSAAVLARQLFHEKDAVVVFGIGAGLAIGGGEGLSAQLLTANEWLIRNGYIQKFSFSQSMFVLFYMIAIIWTVIGLFCTIKLTSEKKQEMRKDQNGGSVGEISETI